MYKKNLDNKGFAISGMLYTLFALFLIIMFSILAMSNFKRNILIKTTKNLEESYTLIPVENINEAFKNGEVESRVIDVSGKYIFKTKIQGMEKKCSAYLKKGTKIPENISLESTSDNFSLIPNDCNEYYSTIIIDDNPTEILDEENMILTEVYIFKKNEKESG